MDAYERALKKIEDCKKKYPITCCIVDKTQFSIVPTYAYASLVGINSVQVEEDGVTISLPDYQVVSGVDVNDQNNVFTILKSGIYRVVFHINGEGHIFAFSRLILNGEVVPQTVINQGSSQPSQSAEVLLPLKAGDKISLELYGFSNRITLGAGVGASLSIYKL